MTDNGARAEIQRVERRLNDIDRQIRGRLQAMEVKLNTAVADVEHRLVVLESQMENVRARLDGHDLGFATMGLNEEGKDLLARMQRLGHRTIGPGEEGTPGS